MKLWLCLVVLSFSQTTFAAGYEERELEAGQTVSGVVYELTGKASLWLDSKVSVLHPNLDREYEKTEQVMRRLPIGTRVRIFVDNLPTASDHQPGPVGKAQLAAHVPGFSFNQSPAKSEPVPVGSVRSVRNDMPPVFVKTSINWPALVSFFFGALIIALCVRKTFRDESFFHRKHCDSGPIPLIPFGDRLMPSGSDTSGFGLEALDGWTKRPPESDFSDLAQIFPRSDTLPEQSQVEFDLSGLFLEEPQTTLP